MNEKQERFCAEYVVDHNGTQAAIRAGYSAKTAAPIASRLLRDVIIKQKIAEMAQKVDTTDAIASAEEVLRYLTSTMRGETFDQIMRKDDEGNLARFNVVAKVSDRNRAAEALAKHYALLVERVEVSKPKTELAAEIEAVLNGR